MTAPALVPMDEVTTALLTLFGEAGRKVWDGAYGGSPTSASYPYHILYRIAGGSSDAMPDLGGSPRTVVVPYQLTTVSNLRNQCEKASAAARDRFLARTRAGFVHPMVLPAGWRDVDRRPDPAMPGIDRVGNEPNAVYSLPARYYLTLTPA